MREELRALDVDGQHVGAVAVAADGVDASAELRPAEHHEQNCHDHQRDDDADLHIGRDIRAELIDRAHAGDIDARLLEGLEGLVFHVELRGVDDGRHALGEEHASEGDDEGLDLQIRDQKALHEAESRADAERKQDGRQDRAAMEIQIDRAAHAHERGERADGDVDAARDHDEAHAAGKNEQGRVFVEDIEEGLRLFEARAEEQYRAQIHDDEDADRDDEQQLCVRQAASARERRMVGFIPHGCRPPSFLRSCAAF